MITIEFFIVSSMCDEPETIAPLPVKLLCSAGVIFSAASEITQRGAHATRIRGQSGAAVKYSLYNPFRFFYIANRDRVHACVQHRMVIAADIESVAHK
jgi:hypothetical protein